MTAPTVPVELRNQPIGPRARHSATRGATEIVINNIDRTEAMSLCQFDEVILPARALKVLSTTNARPTIFISHSSIPTDTDKEKGFQGE